MRNIVCSKVVGSNPSRIGAASMALILTLAAAPPALADDDKTEAAQEAAAVAAAKLTLSQAIEAAQREVPDAKVLKAEVDTENGVPSYVVEVEKDGVQRLVFDLKTGQMTKVAAEKDDNGGNDDSAKRDEDDEEDEDEDDE
jgi:type II secretory pathway pseudopilin PulG